MTQLFNRQAKITVVNTATRVAKVIDSLPDNRAGKIFGGLRIKFKIGKTSESHPNKSELEIYNLNKDSRAFFNVGDLQVTIEAGYKGLIEKIFTGNVSQNSTATAIIHKSDPPDVITTLKLGDGEKSIDLARVDKTFKTGTSVQSIIVDMIKSFTLADAFGVPSTKIDSIPDITSQILTSGMSVTGSPKRIMDDFAKTYNFEWSIQNGVVVITKDKEPTKETAILISQSTGLLGTIENKDKGAIKFKNLLNPKIAPGRALAVKQGIITYYYKVDTVDFEADTHSQPWWSIVEAQPLGTEQSIDTLFTESPGNVA